MSLSILMHWVQKFWLWGRFVAEKQTFVLNLMAGHLLNMTYNENGKWNVWELDHYIDRSSLGIHFWDLYWKMAYLKFEKFWYANVRPWETVQIWGDCPRGGGGGSWEINLKPSPDVRQFGNGPLHCHRETQQLQTHLPITHAPLQASTTSNWDW